MAIGNDRNRSKLVEMLRRDKSSKHAETRVSRAFPHRSGADFESVGRVFESPRARSLSTLSHKGLSLIRRRAARWRRMFPEATRKRSDESRGSPVHLAHGRPVRAGCPSELSRSAIRREAQPKAKTGQGAAPVGSAVAQSLRDRAMLALFLEHSPTRRTAPIAA